MATVFLARNAFATGNAIFGPLVNLKIGKPHLFFDFPERTLDGGTVLSKTQARVEAI